VPSPFEKFNEESPNFINILSDYNVEPAFPKQRSLRYCGLAPTVLAGKIDPALFEVLYVSCE